MGFDIAELGGLKLKRKRGGQRDPLLRSNQLEIAMTYYRFFYVDGDTRTIAIKRTKEEFRHLAPTTIVDAIAYYNSREGQKRLKMSSSGVILNIFKALGGLLDDYRKKGYWKKGKPLPGWLEEVAQNWRTPKKE